MTTYDYLNNAEQQLRSALKTSVDKEDSYQLRRIAEVIDTVSQIKSRFEKTDTITFPAISNFGNYYDPYNTIDKVVHGDFMVGSTGTDTITFR